VIASTAGASPASSSTDRFDERRDRTTLAVAEPTASNATEPPPDEGPAGTAAPDVGADVAADVGRRRFFRQFAGEIATTAATVMGAAQALQRTSAELAGVILDPSRLDEDAGPGAVAAAPEAGPAFRTAFRVEGNTLRLLDQRALPRTVVEHTAATAADVTFAIRNGVIVGGPAAGQAAAIGMGLTAARVRATRPYARRATFRGAANAMRNAAPSNGAVATAMDRVMAAYAGVGELSEDGDAIVAAMQAEGDAIVADALTDHGALVEAGVALLAGLPRPDGGPLRILVHGPGGTLAGGQFGTALAVAMTAHQREVPIRVVVPEGRPRFVGSRVSCWELAAAGVSHLLVADAAAPSLIAAGEVDAILVPVDRLAANGDVAAAIGTYPLAVVADRHGVPVIACVAASVVTPATPDGAAIGIGYLDAGDLDRFEKTALAPAGTETRVPTHDITPAELVTTWLLADGPRTPPFGTPADEADTPKGDEPESDAPEDAQPKPNPEPEAQA
jgi:methylthioribose-1-phosphate isomerase